MRVAPAPSSTRHSTGCRRVTATGLYGTHLVRGSYIPSYKGTDLRRLSPGSFSEFNRFLSAMPDLETPDLQTVLETAEVIAVVGCSAQPTRTSHKIAQYIQQRGYRIVPVNPNYDDVLGEPCYPDLPSVPDDVDIDIVDIFRAPKHTADMVRTAIERMEQRGQSDTSAKPVIWTQLGVSSPEAEELAAEAGFPYVRNRCIKIEYDRLLA